MLPKTAENSLDLNANYRTTLLLSDQFFVTNIENCIMSYNVSNIVTNVEYFHRPMSYNIFSLGLMKFNFTGKQTRARKNNFVWIVYDN